MNKYKILLTGLLLTSIFSCKKLVEIKETDFIDGSKAFTTVENAEQGLIGAYSIVTGEGNMYVNSVLSDEIRVSEFPSDPTVHSWTYAADDISLTRGVLNTFGLNYQAIDRVNRVLEALPETDSTRAGDNVLRLQVKGESLALRAYLHFEMFRWYADNYTAEGLGMPYMETPSLEDQARINLSTYLSKINADLAEAKNLIPAAFTDIFRINRNTVIGMQARVALYQKDWAAAETYATEFINAIPLAPRGSFTGIWTDANNLEVAWKLKRLPNTQVAAVSVRPGSFYRGNSTTPTNLGVVNWAVSSKLWDAFDQANDIRFTAYVKEEPLLIAQGRFPRIVRKYEGGGYNTATENTNDYKMFRTGEMYLIRAEARAELNKLAQGAQDLNDLRRARILGYVDLAFADKGSLITAIIDERFKELAFEGHRFWDLKRRGLPVDRRLVDAPNAAATNLPANNFRFVMPIPFFEIQANRLMQQNSGY